MQIVAIPDHRNSIAKRGAVVRDMLSARRHQTISAIPNFPDKIRLGLQFRLQFFDIGVRHVQLALQTRAISRWCSVSRYSVVLLPKKPEPFELQELVGGKRKVLAWNRGWIGRIPERLKGFFDRGAQVSRLRQFEDLLHKRIRVGSVYCRKRL